MQNSTVCDGKNEKTDQRYCLRHAAGLYWLIDTEQTGMPYVRPLPMNEVGAQIWRRIEAGKSRDEICDFLCKEYGISAEQAWQDVEDFYNQLKNGMAGFGGGQ